MIINEKTSMKWNISNKSYYESKGYKFSAYGEVFQINTIDLCKQSKKRVLCQCRLCDKQWPTRRSLALDICNDCRIHLKDNAWTDEEIAILKSEYEKCDDINDIAKKIHRSKNAVGLKARRIGLHKNYKKSKYCDDYYTVSKENEDLEIRILAYSIGDGWISTCIIKLVGDHDYTQYNTGFSGSVSGLTRIQQDLVLLYGEKCYGEIYSRHTKSDGYGIDGKTSCFIVNQGVTNRFLKYGMPTNQKVEVPFLLSTILDTRNKQSCIAALNGLYDAEGTTLSILSNGIGVRAPQIIITKRKFLENNFYEFLEEVGEMLNTLEIEYNLKMEETFTKDYNLKGRVVIKNSYSNLFRLFRVLEFRYAPEKDNTNIIAYWLAKAHCCPIEYVKKEVNLYDECLKRLTDVQKEAIHIVTEIYQNRMNEGDRKVCRYKDFLEIISDIEKVDLSK